MGRRQKAKVHDVQVRLEHVESVLTEIGSMFHILRGLERLLPNIDRLGPRLDLIDELGPRLNIIDELGPRLNIIDELGPRLNIIDELGPRLNIIDELGPRMKVIDDLGNLTVPLRILCNQISVLESVGHVVNRFLTESHVVSETVRVDVETISALAAQIELFNRQLLEQLQKVIEH